MEPADGELSGKVGNLESCVSILKPPSNDLRGRGGAAESLIAMPKCCYFLCTSWPSLPHPSASACDKAGKFPGTPKKPTYVM